MEDFIIKDENYAAFMAQTVEPFLAGCRTEHHIPREAGKSLYCVTYNAEDAAGTVVISHGFTETAEKYLEISYYFVKHGYHVYMLEHCGHGRSYRLVDGDLSLVHIDRYERYVEDLLAVADMAKQAHPELPLLLYGHSMGGGVAAAALARRPELFKRAVLSSPMIRPLTGSVPWPVTKLLAGMLCGVGKAKEYVPGGHPFDGKERFEDSASTSRVRFEYYQKKRNTEPLYQMCAASCGWLNEAAKLNRYLLREGWKHIRTPLLIFQAEKDAYVSNAEQERFAEKVKTAVGIRQIAGTKHEIFNSDEQVIADYWEQVFRFLSE